ncbi:hypothetical protein M3Y96_00330600 [Aphelenchoides besseyi]|nr:hypothetical protein M3Y96_00330600 [Aphelenchoides besseyi]
MKFFCIPLFNCHSALPESLDYSQLRLEEVPKEVYKARKYLEDLNLNVNGIEHLPMEFFRLLKLKKLDISENKLKVLPPEIGFLHSLMDLNLRQNEFVELPEELGHCVNLLSLNISTNILPELPKSIVNLHMMTSLNISNNSFTQLPSDIHKLVNLQHLDAGTCEIRVLPPEIARLSRLRVLDLCENYLTELPDGMEGLQSLEILDLRGNLLTGIPPGLLSCKTLRSLDLSKNSINGLPENIGDLSNLLELSLCENKINAVPSSIGSMKKLELFKITRNCLLSLTPAICSCYELRDLLLYENQLVELPSSIGNLEKLSFLDVSSNHLTNLPSTIGGCKSLGVLALRQNKLKTLPMEIGKLENLKVLNVAENDLTYLPYTLTVLYDRKTLSALWISHHQPQLPKLTPTFEPVSHVKVLTCCYLPQSDRQSNPPHVSSKSCVVGTRVCFPKELIHTNEGETIMMDIEEDEDKIPIGKFERYDTPHPKPFAPKNRINRNSGDFTGIADTNTPIDGVESESRPLRSVLKRRPLSTYSDCQNPETIQIDEFYKARTRVIQIQRDANGELGWKIAGGDNNRDTSSCVFISHITPGSAADKAGFLVGDRLLSVNDITFTALPHEDVLQLVRDAGNCFSVKIERLSAEETADTLPIDGSLTNRMNIPSIHANPQPSNLPAIAAEPRSTAFSVHTSAPIAQLDSSGSPASRLSPLTSMAPEIISLTLKRDRQGSAGFSVTGSGAPNDRIRISEINPNGPAQISGKLSVGDRICSVNGISVKNASHDKVVAFLRSTNDLHLVVERDHQSAFSSPYNSNLAHARSLTSLLQNLPQNLSPPSSPPPLPPRRRATSQLNLAGDQELANFDYKAAIQAVKNMSTNLTQPSTKRNSAEIAAAVRAANPSVHDVVFNERVDSPLATSSPVPPSMSRIPTRMPNGREQPTTSAPLVPPKPKLQPERMDFKSKLKNFEEQIAENCVTRPALGVPPPKKPLVSDFDRQKLREAESQRQQTENVDESPQASEDYERLLTNSIGPSVVRTAKAEKRARRAAEANGTYSPQVSTDDVVSLDRKPSDLEGLEEEQRKRQAWRQARLRSMEISSNRSEEVIKRLNNIPASPIPTL